MSRRFSKRKPKPLRPASPKKETRPPIDLNDLWLRVRSGAANVAGVRYQLAVTAFMLTGTQRGVAVEELTPEGLEDIDCRLPDSRLLLIQAKERAGGDGRFGPSNLYAAIEHAGDALHLDPSARLAIVTDAELAGGLAETGFEQSVADALPAVVSKLVGNSEPSYRSRLEASILRTHIIRLDWIDIHEKVRRRLEESYRLPPGIAGIAYALLLEGVAAAASDQRRNTRDGAISFRPSDLDVIVHRVREMVDIERLEFAEREGLIEPLDFTQPLSLTPERFLLGVDVEPGHIAAGLDVVRADELDQIFAGLRDDHYVLVAGPSGAGKSALIWRAAYELGGRFRLLRLRRLDSHNVAEVLRYLRVQRPSLQAPILICGDDLGRPAIAGWEEAVDQLLELPGVFILGAVREEDFRSSLLRGRAQVVRPILNRRLAEEIVAQLEKRKVPFALEPHDAFARADGLLMEFLALLVAGRRLRDIVNAQVEERFSPERAVEREVLRYVTSAHVYAVALPSSALSALVPLPDELPAALQKLQDEFLVQRADANRWTGLHELRSRTVTTRLHQLPPPSEAETLVKLLPVVAGRDRRTLIVGAALAGYDLSALGGAAEELFATEHLNAMEIYALLDGFIEAEELTHARACLEFVRRQTPALDAVSILPLLQGLRDGWMDSLAGLPNGAALVALAAALPPRHPSIAATTAAHLSERPIAEAIALSPTAEAVGLLELLAFLGRSLPIDPVQGLIRRTRADGDTGLVTRAIAALAQATPGSVRQLDCIAGTLESRLDAIAEHRRDVLNWELAGPESNKTANIETAEYGDGKLSDRLFDLCRLVYEGCPEIEQVNVVALAADGNKSAHPNGHKSPLRRYVLNPIREIRRNIAFGEALQRLTAADSWSERLRRQEDLVCELKAALADAIPRLLNPHDNLSRKRSWLEAVDRIRSMAERLPAVPLPPSSAVDRSDKAKGILDRLSFALTQLGQAVARDSFDNLWGLGSQFQGAFGEAQASTEAVAGAGAELRDWPIVRRLLTHLEVLRDMSDELGGLLLALQHDRNLLHRVPRPKIETWQDVARRLIGQARDVLVHQERDELERVIDGLDCELWLVNRSRPGQVRLVNDFWLVVCEFEQWPAASERLFSLPEETQLAISFRTYVIAAVDGLVLPIFTKMLGSYKSKPFLYPVSLEDATEIAKEVGLEVLRSPRIEDALRLFDLVLRASGLAAIYRLRDERFSREREHVAAMAAIEEARSEIMQVGDRGIRRHLFEALAHVEGELEGPRGRSLASEIQDTVFSQRDTEATRLAHAVVVSALDASLSDATTLT